MRSFLARLALASTVGIAISGCGTTSGSSLPVGAFPNGSAGAPQAQVANQPPPPGSIPGLALIGAFTTANSFVGFNTTASDAASTNDYTTETQVADSGPPPKAPGGSHLITFSGNGTPVVNFRYTGTTAPLVIPPLTPGQITAQTYGSIIVHAPVPLPTLGGLKPTMFLELVGGSGTTAYDVRTNCSTKVTAATTLARYVCLLPAYGAASSAGIQSPVLAGASGVFAPTSAPAFYVGESFGATGTSTAASSTLNFDFAFAEQGVL